MNDKIKAAAAEEGYEIAHYQLSLGEHSFGLQILVKMSNRKLCDKDTQFIYRIAEQIKEGLDTVSASLDPQGPLMRAKYREEIEDIYRKAGVCAIYLEPLPNGYCSQPCCLNRPWFRVTSSIGHVVIGWRKRVFSIDWSATTNQGTAAALFPAEDVTKGDRDIHAWSIGKAVEYIKRLHGQ